MRRRPERVRSTRRGPKLRKNTQDTERVVSAAPCDDDLADLSLRPRRLREMIGQLRVKENLSVFIDAARGREEPLDHILLHGPPGLGKTTLSNIVANEMQTRIRVTSGPAIEKPGDLAAILTSLEPDSVFFIDEIHRLNRTVEEILYPAMEDFKLDIVIGRGPSARTVRLDVPAFTLIGATTRSGLLSSPLRDRFGIQLAFELYQPEELETIVLRSATILNIPIDHDSAAEIACRSRGTPRVANRILKRVRDYAQARADGRINRSVADQALRMLDVDELGLEAFDRRFLRAIATKFDAGPVGLETLAAMLGEESATIEDVYEPFLLQIGFLNRTSRGRCTTRAAHLYLDLPWRERPDATAVPVEPGTLFSN
ncbi:MAG: Holliday junction branch migration DNA helicase RuvB [Armatimonadetes bacterium]|nr:Holliday junction branch migration DNA helicase RuvB [Armatimonadota bacterium]MDE2206269.1 Holliday junction branch migration DNA helicase RuvB [Armatimonadota bacterium]